METERSRTVVAHSTSGGGGEGSARNSKDARRQKKRQAVRPKRVKGAWSVFQMGKVYAGKEKLDQGRGMSWWSRGSCRGVAEESDPPAVMGSALEGGSWARRLLWWICSVVDV